MSDRPVYIPSRKRKKKQHFHGAFTGGFSAGHFNTVGTEEGWEPSSQEALEVRREQKPQDFMDEQDHNEWGGVKAVREEYAASNKSSSVPLNKNDSLLADLVKPPAQNVGHKLLRILGWRNGSTAYVPQDDTTATLLKPAEQSIESLLSSRRLHKIQLQQKRVKLPPPKQDTCGLGYERYHNAPEFRAHRERRRKEAQERAKAVTASSAENRNVYRLSDLLDKDEDGSERPQASINRRTEEEDDPLVTYETEQSFVGTKTVGGFALREDDDDVYDDNFKESKANREEYDTVVYEHASEDDDEGLKRESAEGEEFGSVFASWASTSKTATSGEKSSSGITSDGRPPLPGFVLGSSTSSRTMQRFPGPDIPSGYEPKRHEFGDDEHAGAWKDELHDSRQEQMEQRRKATQAERKAEMAKKEKERDVGPMAGVAFAGLAAAMKNRFTSSANDSLENGGTPPAAVGLQPGGAKAFAPAEPVPVEKPVPKPLTIQRTTMTFVPESLLCKRFHVVAPARSKPTVGGGKKVPELKGEHAYFEREIMSKATAASGTGEKKTDTKQPAVSLQEQVLGSSDTQEEPASTRPSMKVLESIFEPDSEASESDQEEEDDGKVPSSAGPQDQLSGGLSNQAPATLPDGLPDGILAPAAAELPPVSNRYDSERNDEKVESESRKDKKRTSRNGDERKRRRRSPSRSPSRRSPDRAKKKRSRKREDRKKRKKRHKSSRRIKSDY